MEWRELSARWRAKFESVSHAVRLRVITAAVMTTVLVVAGVAVVAARSGSAASPPGASASQSASVNTGATRSHASAVSSDAVSVTTAARSVVVSVAGAVARPGVVTLPSGARVVDAISAAGGAQHGADPNALDLAAKLVDGVRIYVPKVGEHVSPAPSGSTASGGSGGSVASPPTPNGPVDLNTASAADLEALPGIGPSLAQAIIATRDRLGGFHSVDELREVRGIGDRRLADLRPLVTV